MRATLVSAERLVRIRELTQPPFDWTRLVGLSEEHGVWPLVYTHVTAAGAGMPAEPATHLAQRLVETTAVNLALCGQLTDILATLARAGIAAVALKGPVLARAYGHLGIRPFSDLDVLVPRHRASDAVAALCAEGYRRADQYSVADGVYPLAGREYVLVPNRADRVAVEVQVDVTSFPLPVGLSAGRVDRPRPDHQRRWPRDPCARGRGSCVVVGDSRHAARLEQPAVHQRSPCRGV